MTQEELATSEKLADIKRNSPREWHVPCDNPYCSVSPLDRHCDGCGEEWPCATVAALDRAEIAEARVRVLEQRALKLAQAAEEIESTLNTSPRRIRSYDELNDHADRWSAARHQLREAVAAYRDLQQADETPAADAVQPAEALARALERLLPEHGFAGVNPPEHRFEMTNVARARYNIVHRTADSWLGTVCDTCGVYPFSREHALWDTVVSLEESVAAALADYRQEARRAR